MKKTKTITSLLVIWVAILLTLIVVDYYALRQPFYGNTFANCRIILPSSSQANTVCQMAEEQSLTDEQLWELLTSNLGYPNGSDITMSVGNAYWDLQFGARLWVSFYGAGFFDYHVTPILLASARWLIFPGIMLCVALIELLVCRKILRSR